MATHKVADASELDDGSRVHVEIKGREIAVFQHEGDYYAVLNYCVHQAGPLCDGVLTGRMEIGDDGWEWTYDSEEKHVVCPWHGWKFDITTGHNTEDPRYVVPTYEVEERDGELFVTFS